VGDLHCPPGCVNYTIRLLNDVSIVIFRWFLTFALINLPIMASAQNDVSPNEKVRQTQIANDSAGASRDTGVFIPPDSARQLSILPLFRWPAIAGVQFYHVQVCEDSAFLSLALNDTVAVDTTRRMSIPLLNDHLYCWRVGWRDSSDTLVFTKPMWFRTASPPAFSSSSCIFPPTRRGSQSSTRVRILNPIEDTVFVDSAMFGRGQFRVVSPLPTHLLPHDSLELEVTYAPDRFSILHDTLVVFSRQGVSTLPVIAESPYPMLHVAFRNLPFSAIRTSDTAFAVAEIANLGPVNDLHISRASTRTPFFTPEKSSYVIRPNAQVRLLLSFQVKAMRGERFGSYNDTLQIVSDGGIVKIALSGDSPPPRPLLSARALDFGLIGIPDSSSGTITIRNGSINDLVIDSVSSRRRVFRPNLSRGKVSHADSLRIVIRFRPEKFGAYADTLIVHNNSWGGPIRIACAAEVPPPAIEADFERVNFGKINLADSGVVTIRVRNTSLSLLRIDSVKTRTRQYFRIANPVPRRLLWRGEELPVRIAFIPDTLRRYFDTLVIVNNSETMRYKIPLFAEGVPSLYGTLGSRSMVYELYQNFPNPFSTQTTFSYNLPQRSRVRLEVFTTLGQRLAIVVDGEQDAGVQNVPWESALTSGVYYFRLYATAVDDPASQFADSRKMVVVR
jgi:hypothetical protein